MNAETKIPNHIAFIMDGNGRWAKKRGLPRKIGHKEGAETLRKVIDASIELGVKNVTFYAFSTENWKRPKEEVDELFNLIRIFVQKELKKYVEKDIDIRFIGNIDGLPEDIQNDLRKIKHDMKGGQTVVQIALNYGGRDEIVNAVNELIQEGKTNVTEEDISSKLYTVGVPDPDIVVRTAGEKRLSNFLLYQVAYSEFVFVDKLWPDFNKEDLIEVINEFNSRTRRFGAVVE